MPISSGLFERLNQLLTEQPKYNYAESRLSHGPMILADPAQYERFSPGHLGDTVQSISPLNRSPLAGPVREQLAKGQKPIVMGNWDPMSVTPSAYKDTVGQVTGHESTHQLIGGSKLPLSIFYSQIPPAIQGAIHQELSKQGYPPSQFGDEIPARLANRQYASLGVTPEQGQALWQKYLELYQQANAANAGRLRSYTKTPANAPNLPELMKLLQK